MKKLAPLIIIFAFLMGYSQHQRMVIPKGTYEFNEISSQGKNQWRIPAYCLDPYLPPPPENGSYIPVVEGQIEIEFKNGGKETRKIHLGNSDELIIRGIGDTGGFNVENNTGREIKKITFGQNVQLKYIEDKDVKLVKNLDFDFSGNSIYGIQEKLWGQRKSRLKNKRKFLEGISKKMLPDKTIYESIIKSREILKIQNDRFREDYKTIIQQRESGTIDESTYEFELDKLGKKVKAKAVENGANLYFHSSKANKQIRDFDDKIEQLYAIYEPLDKKLKALNITNKINGQTLYIEDRLQIFKNAFNINSEDLGHIEKELDFFIKKGTGHNFNIMGKNGNHFAVLDSDYKNIKFFYDAYAESFGIDNCRQILNEKRIDLKNTVVLNVFRHKTMTESLILRELNKTGFKVFDVFKDGLDETTSFLKKNRIQNVIVSGHYEKDIVFGYSESGEKKALPMATLVRYFKKYGVTPIFFGCESALASDIKVPGTTDIIDFNKFLNGLSKSSKKITDRGTISYGTLLEEIAKETETTFLANIMSLNNPKSSLSKDKRIQLKIDGEMSGWKRGSYGFEFVPNNKNTYKQGSKLINKNKGFIMIYPYLNNDWIDDEN